MISFLRKSTVQDKMRIVSLPLYMIAPNPNQPRKYFEPQAMEELKNSIMEYGLIQPVTVRRRSGEYELVAVKDVFVLHKWRDLTKYRRL